VVGFGSVAVARARGTLVLAAGVLVLLAVAWRDRKLLGERLLALLICLIAITGDREPQLLSAVEEAGADAVLLKEELVETLVDRLRHVRQTA